MQSYMLRGINSDRGCNTCRMATSHILFPCQLKLISNISAEWKTYVSQWNKYKVVTDLYEQSKHKKAAIFLVCIGNDIYELPYMIAYKPSCV